MILLLQRVRRGVATAHHQGETPGIEVGLSQEQHQEMCVVNHHHRHGQRTSVAVVHPCHQIAEDRSSRADDICILDQEVHLSLHDEGLCLREEEGGDHYPLHHRIAADRASIHDHRLHTGEGRIHQIVIQHIPGLDLPPHTDVDQCHRKVMQAGGEVPPLGHELRLHALGEDVTPRSLQEGGVVLILDQGPLLLEG